MSPEKAQGRKRKDAPAEVEPSTNKNTKTTAEISDARLPKGTAKRLAEAATSNNSPQKGGIPDIPYSGPMIARHDDLWVGVAYIMDFKTVAPLRGYKANHVFGLVITRIATHIPESCHQWNTIFLKIFLLSFHYCPHFQRNES